MDQGQLFRRVLARALLLSARRFNQLCTLSLATRRVQPCVVAYGPVRQAGKFDLMWLRRTFSVRANISAFKKGEHECRHLSHHTNYHTDSCTERMSSPCAFTQQIREVPWYASGCVPRVRTLQHAIQNVCAPGCVMRVRVCVCARGAQRGVQPHLANFNWNRSGQTNSSWWLTPHGATLCLLCSKFVSTLRSRIHHAV